MGWFEVVRGHKVIGNAMSPFNRAHDFATPRHYPHRMTMSYNVTKNDIKWLQGGTD